MGTAIVKNQLSYNQRKDEKNCVSFKARRHESRAEKIVGNRRILEVLKESQPRSIYDPETQSLLSFEEKITILRRAIVLPESYELFWAPWIADGSYSYPSDEVRSDWKTWFPTAHNSIAIGDGHFINQIGPERFDNLKILLDEKYKFIIRNHSDSNNYWHWTFEWLPRIFSLAKLIKERPCIRPHSLINIGKALNKFQIEWIRVVLGVDYKIQNYSQGLLCNNLIWITPPFPAHHRRETLLEIRNRITFSRSYIEKSQNCTKRPKRLYIRRGLAKNGRNIKNENDIIEILKPYGFVVVSMDELSVYEQARYFSKAEVVVGPHGSAFVNMVFCKKKCKIIEFFGPGYLSGHDYSLAFNCNLDWEHFEGEGTESNNYFNSDYYISPEKFRKRIELLL